MKILSVTIVNEDNSEETLNVVDGTALLVCDDNKILTQITTNSAVNMEVLKKILKP